MNRLFQENELIFKLRVFKNMFFFFAIPSHNANVERIFSLMNAQWTEERNRLSVDAIKNLLMVQYNFKQFDCLEFYKCYVENKKLLAEVRNKAKYSF